MTKVELETLAGACQSCQQCWIPYLLPPVLGYLPRGATVLVMGQNPAVPKITGEVEEYDTDGPFESLDYLDFYGRWLKKSSMAKQLEPFFGPNWLDSGRFAFTNAVRCRTPKNARPSQTVIDNCTGYSVEVLKGYDKVILMGSVAMGQFLKSGQFNKIYRINKTLLVYTLPHYAAMARTKIGYEEALKLVPKFLAME